ncbi:MAG: leucine-rich repeat protein, partial [Clostridia bacterium]|nr:leucine-rich repeat protein [Clostridia bacterium]
MKKFTKVAALLLAAVVCAGTAAAETISENGVTYESAKVDSRRLVRYLPDKPETEFTISNTSVDAYAFEGAENLEKITISDGVFYIGEYAFKDCTSLKEVVIDKTWGGVVSPENAFDGCTSLDPAVIDELCWENPFHDVYPQDMYYDAVKFVHRNGLMNGMADDRFAPDTGMTRAMFVTVLGRLAGVTEVHT